jgi:hypothetical protein
MQRRLFLPTPAEVTAMTPSTTPRGTCVCIHRCGRINGGFCIDGIFLNDHRRRSYNDRSANHDGFGSGLLDNNRRRTAVLICVEFPLITWNVPIGGYRQIGGGCRRGKS